MRHKGALLRNPTGLLFSRAPAGTRRPNALTPFLSPSEVLSYVASMGYTAAMRRSIAGKLNTGATAAILLVLVVGLGVAGWHSGLLPIRLRQDGLYGGGNAPPGTASPGTLIDRPKLYLPAPKNIKPGFVRVTRVIDGDTIVVAEDLHVRLIGVDTEELGKDKVDPQSRAWQAALWVQSRLEGDAQVKLQYDAERKDKYDRTLAYVILTDGSMLNDLLLQQGWARTMKIAPNTRYASHFAELELEARDQRLGRWAE